MDIYKSIFNADPKRPARYKASQTMTLHPKNKAQKNMPQTRFALVAEKTKASAKMAQPTPSPSKLRPGIKGRSRQRLRVDAKLTHPQRPGTPNNPVADAYRVDAKTAHPQSKG